MRWDASESSLERELGELAERGDRGDQAERTDTDEFVAASTRNELARNTLRGGPADASVMSMECGTRRRYDVRFCDSVLEPRGALAAAIGDRAALVVTTPTVERLYGAQLRIALGELPNVSVKVIDASEDSKSLARVETVCKEALARGIDRRGVLVAFGGGVCSDIVTVAASMVRRGIAHIRVPTTLIGQIDAGIGLKGAVNFTGKKSFVGCFHPPEQVLIDPAFLRSLPRRFLVAGTAEAVKMGISRDERLFELFERHAVAWVGSAFDSPADEAREALRRSVWSMLDELRQNPYEDQGYARIVDFGHTFSPLLEAATGFALQHGEAVAIDMALSATLARTLGVIPVSAWERIVGTLRTASLPVSSEHLDLTLCRNALAEAQRHRGGAVNLVVPAGIGRATFLSRREDIPDSALEESLRLLSDWAMGQS